MAPAQRQPSIRPRLEDKNQVQSESSQEEEEKTAGQYELIVQRARGWDLIGPVRRPIPKTFDGLETKDAGPAGAREALKRRSRIDGGYSESDSNNQAQRREGRNTACSVSAAVRGENLQLLKGNDACLK